MNKKHFSLSDWDYRVGAKLELASDRFISSPTALRTQNLVAGYQDEAVYLGTALGQNIPEGRYLTWHYDKDKDHFRLYFLFRCQDIKYTTLPDNCYYIYFDPGAIILWRREAGVDTHVHTDYFDPNNTQDQWYHFRFSFFQYLENNLHVYLRVIVEREEAGEWIPYFTWGDEINKWADSNINRLGFILRAWPDPNYTWMDDTEIWEKTS